MPLTRAEVEHVAHLAHIALKSDEIQEMAHELSSIIDHVAKLQEVDTSHIEEVTGTTSLHNVVRADDTAPSWPVQAVLANAPHAIGQQFEVQAILD